MDIIIIVGVIIYLMLIGVVLYVNKVSNEYSNAQISKQNVDLVNKILDVHLEDGAYDKDKLHNSLSKFYDEVIINEYQETPYSPICLSIQIIDYETKWYNNKQYITTDVILRKLDVDKV
ncbi:MAG: hypothetical protein GX359_11575 [Clostridiales bacterium]|nr:hypothetical protein [Clostridiales bacterium]